MSSRAPYDMIIVGAGIVGLATAWELVQRRPDARLLILDKESRVGAHQTGHNSGVIHSGLYYRPGSLKATLTRSGHRLLTAFCDREQIPYELSGKLVVAVRHEELSRLEQLYQNGLVNQVPDLKMVSREEMSDIEPHVRGLKAIYSPKTGIVDYGMIAARLANRLQTAGHDLLLNHSVDRIQSNGSIRIHTAGGDTFVGATAIVAAGIGADRLAQRSGLRHKARMIPFRGDYLVLRPERRSLVRSLIYPVPDPRLPFLGVHFTRRIHDGSVWIGPNAVLAGSRAGYHRGALNKRDLWDTVTFPGFWLMARQHWRSALGEWFRDYAVGAYVAMAREYVPELSLSDVRRGPMGIRAQLVDADGGLVDDFRILPTNAALFVLNAPSPAATSSFAIARYLVESAANAFGWKLRAKSD